MSTSTTVPAAAALLGVTEESWQEGIDAVVAVRMQGQSHASADAMRTMRDMVAREMTAAYEQQAAAQLAAYEDAERAWASSLELRQAYGGDQGAFIRSRLGNEPHRSGASEGALQMRADFGAVRLQRLDAWTAALHDKSPGAADRAKLAKLRYLEVRPKG